MYTVADKSDYINRLLSDVNISSIEYSKGALSMACAQMLTCADAEEIVSMLKEPDDEMPQSQKMFLSCLFLMHEQIQKEKLWKINEEFIADLGSRFINFITFNSLD